MSERLSADPLHATDSRKLRREIESVDVVAVQDIAVHAYTSVE
jgi:hypothetical protein